MPDLDTLALRSIALSRTLGPTTARVLARQGLISFADVQTRSNADLLALRGLGPVLLRRLRRLTDILIRTGQLPSEARSTDPWDRLERDDPKTDLLIAGDLLTAEHRDTLAAVCLHHAGLHPDTVMNAAVFGCRTLLDVATLAPARIACFTPKAFADLRAHLQLALEGRLIEEDADQPVTAPTRRPRAPAATTAVPAILRLPLRGIPIAALDLPEPAFQAMREDGIDDAYALVRRAPAVIAARYELSPEALAALRTSLAHALARCHGDSVVRAHLVGHGALAAWIETAAPTESEAWIALRPSQAKRLRNRAVRLGNVGLTARACDWLTAAGCATLDEVARLPIGQIQALFAAESASLPPLRLRIEILARQAAGDDLDAQDVDVLREDGFGADLCHALALAGYPILGLARDADLTGIPEVPADLVASLKRAILARLTPTDRVSPRRRLLDLDATHLTWLRTQPVSALDAPGTRKGVVHRLRQAGLSDLAAVADAPRDQIAALGRIGETGAERIAARIIAILAETPLPQRAARSALPAAA